MGFQGQLSSVNLTDIFQTLSMNRQSGTLVVTSLGSSTGGATSSVGAGAVVMDNTNAVVLGNATTTGGNLQYVGPGETSLHEAPMPVACDLVQDDTGDV